MTLALEHLQGDVDEQREQQQDDAERERQPEDARAGTRLLGLQVSAAIPRSVTTTEQAALWDAYRASLMACDLGDEDGYCLATRPSWGRRAAKAEWEAEGARDQRGRDGELQGEQD